MRVATNAGTTDRSAPTIHLGHGDGEPSFHLVVGANGNEKGTARDRIIRTGHDVILKVSEAGLERVGTSDRSPRRAGGAAIPGR